MTTVESNQSPLRIGVLALQGAFEEHCHMLSAVGGVEAIEVREKEQLESVCALVIPGGESTAMMLIAERWNLVEPLKKFVESGKPVWGTCAGLILLSNDVRGVKQNGQAVLGGMDLVTQRNYFGSQVGSFEAKLTSPEGFENPEDNFVAVFIRGPGVLSTGEGVQVLSTVEHTSQSMDAVGHGEPVVVAVRQGNLLGTSFHPELTGDKRWHDYFVKQIVQPSVEC